MAKFLCITLALCAVASASPILSLGSGLGGLSGLTSGLGSLGGVPDLTSAPQQVANAAQGIVAGNIGNILPAINGAGLPDLTSLASSAPLQQAANTVASLTSALPIAGILNRQARDISLNAAIPSQAANAALNTVQNAANTAVAAGKSALTNGVAAVQNALKGVTSAGGLSGLPNVASLTGIPLQTANTAINAAKGALETGLAAGEGAISSALSGLPSLNAAGLPGLSGASVDLSGLASAPLQAVSAAVSRVPSLSSGISGLSGLSSGISGLSGLSSGISGLSSGISGLSGLSSGILNRQTRDLSLAAAIPSQAANAVLTAGNNAIATGQNAINRVASLAAGLPGLSGISGGLLDAPLAAINSAKGVANSGLATGLSAINGLGLNNLAL